MKVKDFENITEFCDNLRKWAIEMIESGDTRVPLFDSDDVLHMVMAMEATEMLDRYFQYAEVPRAVGEWFIDFEAVEYFLLEL